jgi:hypothetical protein
MHIKAVSNYTEQLEILYGILEYKKFLQEICQNCVLVW